MQSSSLPMPAEKLTRAAKARAAKAIESVHIAYYEKGGIRDLEEKISGHRGAAAKHIFALAIYASENAKTRAEAIALFLGMCAYAEAQYKAEHEITNLKDPVAGLPTWAVFKSNILRGIREFELDPCEYRSEGAFRVAMQKKELAALPSPVSALPVAARGPKAERIAKALQNTELHDTIRLLISQLIFECEVLRISKRAEAEAILKEAMDKLQPYIDARKSA
jgi:hypothetical protein